MTFIQPNKNNRPNIRILAALLFLVAAGSFSVIVLYNNLVNLEHGAAAAKAQTGSIEAQKTDIQSKMFALLDASKSEALSSGELVQEKSPEYFQVYQEPILKMALGIR